MVPGEWVDLLAASGVAVLLQEVDLHVNARCGEGR